MKHNMVTPQEPKPSSTKVETAPALTLKRSELVTQKFQTPETKAAEAKISQITYETLVDSITHTIDISNQMTPVFAKAMFGEFLNAFKAEYPNVDLKNADDVKTKAEKFLNAKGGKGVIASLKLLEVEGALLSAGSKGRFVELKPATPGREPIIVRKFKMVNGKVVVERQYGTVTKINFLGMTKNIPDRGEAAKPGEYEIDMDSTFNYGTNIVSPAEIEYLQKSGFADGTSIDPQVREIIELRLGKIALVRGELFQETGKKISKPTELNFVLHTGNYRTKSPHFIGEGTSLRAGDLATEGATIAAEIKKEVQDKIKAKIEEEQKKKLEGTATQLRAKIEEIKKNAKLSPEEKQKKLLEAKKEVKKLEDELVLFERQKALPDEIKEAEKARDEAKDKVIARETELQSGRADPSIDLIKWSSDMSEPESWLSFKALSDSYKVEVATINQRITDLREELKDHTTARPPGELRKITQVDPSTGVTTTVEPEPVDVQEKEEWSNRRKDLQKLIDDERARIYTTGWAGGTKTLAELVTETEKEYLRRKAIVEDDQATKQIIIGFRNSETAVKDFEVEKVKVVAKIAALAKTESVITDELKKVKENKDNIESDKISVDDLRETEALEGLVVVFSPDELRKQRISEKRQAIVSSASIEIEWGPEFDGYPKALLETIRLMYGEDVLAAYPPGEKEALVKQVKSIISSSNYLGTIIDELEIAEGVVPTNKIADKLTVSSTATNVEITKANLATMFLTYPGNTLLTMDIKKVDEKVIDNILKRMRVQALGIKS